MVERSGVLSCSELLAGSRVVEGSIPESRSQDESRINIAPRITGAVQRKKEFVKFICSNQYFRRKNKL